MIHRLTRTERNEVIQNAKIWLFDGISAILAGGICGFCFVVLFIGLLAIVDPSVKWADPRMSALFVSEIGMVSGLVLWLIKGDLNEV